MKCKRCSGLMVRELFFESTGADRFWGWRCINCGEVMDKVIFFNRIKSMILRIMKVRG